MNGSAALLHYDLQSPEPLWAALLAHRPARQPTKAAQQGSKVETRLQVHANNYCAPALAEGHSLFKAVEHAVVSLTRAGPVRTNGLNAFSVLTFVTPSWASWMVLFQAVMPSGSTLPAEYGEP